MKEKIHPLDIVGYHVGGLGDYSHLNAMRMRYPRRSVFVAFEARLSDNEVRCAWEQETRSFLIQACLSDRRGRELFHLNSNPDSSSLFLAAPEAQAEQMPDQVEHPAWGYHSKTEESIPIETHTLDDLITEHELPPPDVLSIDAQGAEYKILNGGLKALSREVLAAITEVEFSEIYLGQPIFCQQFELLSHYGFRLAEIVAPQYWHPVARIGHGMLTVGEALFLRNIKPYLLNSRLPKEVLINKAIKHAAIAFAFGRLSIAAQTIGLCLEMFGRDALEKLVANEDFFELLVLHNFIDDNMLEYTGDPFFFENHSLLNSAYGPFQVLGRRSLDLPRGSLLDCQITDLDEVNTQVQRVQNEITMLKEQISSKNKEIQALRSRLSEHSTSVEEVKGHIDG